MEDIKYLWTGTMTDELIAGKIQLAAEQAITSLIASMAQTSLLSSVYAYKHRVKSVERLLEKKAIRQEKNQDYCIEGITDVIGIRLVTLFRNQMADIIDQVLSLTCHEHDLNPNPFLIGGVEEVIFYRGNVGSDPILDEIKKIAGNFSAASDKLIDKSSKEGYSSIHIVTRLQNPIGLDGLGDYRLPVEIQIRTVFEDAWGEIDHKFGYPIRTGKVTKEVVNNPGSVLEHLKILKNFSDACANYSEVIYREARGELDIPNMKGSVIGVEPTDSLIDQFREFGVAEASIQQYLEARVLKQEALDDGKNTRKLYEAADAFKDLTVSESVELNFYLYCKLNQAFCLLSTGMSTEIHVAKKMYIALHNQFPDHPLISHRLGQVYNKLGKTDDAIDAFNRAWVQVIKYEKSGKIGSDLLPEADYKHVRRYLPKLLGYNFWLKSRHKIGDEKRDLLFEAYDKTLASIVPDYEGSVLSAHNNLLYYQVELVLYCGELIDKKKNRELGLKHLKEIEGCQNVHEVKNLFHMDTLAKAYYVYGKKAKGVSLAKRIIDQVLNGDFEQVSKKDALEIAQEAKQLIEGSLTGPQ